MITIQKYFSFTLSGRRFINVIFSALGIFLSFYGCNLQEFPPDISKGFKCSQTFLDASDGNRYKTVWIDEDGGHDLNKPGNCWFAENLKFDTNDFHSRCYDDNDGNCDKFGRMYVDETIGANVLNIVPPNGWHVATKAEWVELLEEVFGFVPTHTSIGIFYGGRTKELLDGGSSGLNFKLGGRCDNDVCESIDEVIALWAPDGNHCVIPKDSESSRILLLINATMGEQINREYYIRCIQDK